ncbi:GGDEF domain-containing protein [Kutzneria albida]|uniref:GGDEF domain-containing diguanylate cyclase n=1 Tax=Kutzneria albida DSM 43870 TaxID=1449976 RepID=W5W9G4_9PSEU|nr:GGDEF domain-containing protein [Kutzneria albida]AHH94839.1 GGDEF domain-containing diguanylate cyclase [Kutzneria albida DSM 43870]
MIVSGGHRDNPATGRPGWALWRQANRPLVCYVLAVDLLAAVLTVRALLTIPIGLSQLLPFLVLLACGLLYTEVSQPIERVREQHASSPHIDLNSVWMFAAILLLQPGLAALVIATSYGYRWLRVRRHVVYRQVFSAAATTLAAFATSAVLGLLSARPFAAMPHDVPTFAAVVLAGLVFLVCNTVLLTVAVRAATPGGTVRSALGSRADYLLESATIGLGVLLAWALVDWPVVLLLIGMITLVLHRCVLIRQFREQARTDGKTGLLQATAWTDRARGELARAGASLLMIDLDHFKQINDEHGHLAGDVVLRAVADTIRAQVRGYDPVGRFGGEEFVVLLPRIDRGRAESVAERIRQAILLLEVRLPAATVTGLSASIGVAVCPAANAVVERLLHVADTALYEAKNSGRNRVVSAAHTSW